MPNLLEAAARVLKRGATTNEELGLAEFVASLAPSAEVREAGRRLKAMNDGGNPYRDYVDSTPPSDHFAVECWAVDLLARLEGT